jgi:hypothetical protein
MVVCLVKAGSFREERRGSLPVDERVVDGLFREYDRVVDEQSGIAKRAKIAKLLAGYST